MIEIDAVRAGHLVAASGQKVQGELTVSGTDLKIPLTLLNGSRPGKTVLILSGVHGGEYVGIETVIRLASALKPEDLCGRVILIHPVNLGAFFARVQYIHPLDGKNLNRIFPGQVRGTASEKIAFTVAQELFHQVDFIMDLHGGDIHEDLFPFVVYSKGSHSEVVHKSEAAARHMGIRYGIGIDYPGTTVGAAGQLGIPGFLVEFGGGGRWSEEEVNVYLKGVLNVLRCLQVLPGKAKSVGKWSPLAEYLGTSAEANGCWYPSAKPGGRVYAGEKIGEIRDFFSNLLKTYYADKDGILLFVVQSLAISAGEPLYAIGSFSS